MTGRSTVDWKAAAIVLLLALLLRDRIVSFSLWVAGASTPAVAAQPLVPAPSQVFAAAPAPVRQTPGTWTIPAAPANTVAPPLPVSQAIPMPVVITPTLEYSRNVAIARRERRGHFSFATEVNGVAVPMVFDTGASAVTLCATDAARVGIDTGSLTYSVIGKTANGTAEFAPVTISTLTVGTITRRNVAAMVARPGKLDVNLLGQSFLTRVASVSVAGNELIIRGGDMREDR